MRQSCISNTLNQATLTISARRGCVARIRRPTSLEGLAAILKRVYNDPLSTLSTGHSLKQRSVVRYTVLSSLYVPLKATMTRFVVGSRLVMDASYGVSYLRRYEERGYGTI